MKPTLRIDEPATYRITLCGILNQSRARYFDAVHIETLEQQSILTVTVEDQAALLGLLRQLYNLGLPLLSLTVI